MSRRRRRRGGLGWLLLAVLLLGAAIAAGAWLAGWRWSGWPRSGISEAPPSTPRTAEVISDAERRALKDVLNARDAQQGK